jgi:hypothetical protein
MLTYPGDAVRAAAKRQKDVTVRSLETELVHPIVLPDSVMSTTEEQSAYRQGFRRALRVAIALARRVQ